MLFKWLLIGIVLVTTCTSWKADAHLLNVQPLTGRDVYRVLRAANQEDELPQGRVVSQGVAALAGFTLGLTKGIGGALLVDLATSNATMDYINNFNASAIPGYFGVTNYTSTPEYHEVCFQTTTARNARSLRHDEYYVPYRSETVKVQYDEDEPIQGRQNTGTGGTANTNDMSTYNTANTGLSATGTGTGRQAPTTPTTGTATSPTTGTPTTSPTTPTTTTTPGTTISPTPTTIDTTTPAVTTPTVITITKPYYDKIKTSDGSSVRCIHLRSPVIFKEQGRALNADNEIEKRRRRPARPNYRLRTHRNRK